MPGSELVQSLARGLDLIRLLAESDRGLCTREIMAATGLKRPTLHNLLRTLASRDFVLKQGGRYRLGPAPATLAAEDAAGARLRQAEESVCLLAKRLPQAIVSFCEAAGGEILVRFRQYPNRVLMERNSGAVMAPYQTASGLAVLAFGDVETRQGVHLRHPFQLTGLPVWKSEARLEEFLEEARQQGCVLPPFSRASKFKLAAVPCFEADGLLVGVYGAAWHEDGGAGAAVTEEVLGALRLAAEQTKELTGA